MPVDRGVYSWSPEDAAAVIGCTPDHARALCRGGELVAVLDRRRWWIEPESARRYLVRMERRRSLAVEREEVAGHAR